MLHARDTISLCCAQGAGLRCARRKHTKGTRVCLSSFVFDTVGATFTAQIKLGAGQAGAPPQIWLRGPSQHLRGPSTLSCTLCSPFRNIPHRDPMRLPMHRTLREHSSHSCAAHASTDVVGRSNGRLAESGAFGGALRSEADPYGETSVNDWALSCRSCVS